MNKKVEISFQGEKIELPVITGSENEHAVDISKLRSQTGLITLDRGFKNTGSTSSSITFLDGERGILRYRGYSIEDLAQYSSFLEVSYLLINGQLPNVNELNNFKIIAESGFKSKMELENYKSYGIEMFLIGESILKEKL